MKVKKMLQNNVYIILGQRWSWKSLFASCIARDYKEVFVNYQLKIPGVKVNIFREYEFLRSLKYKEEKRLIILDEWGINFNSREFQRQENKMIGKLLFVSRKYNFDFIFISQYDFTLDKYIRYSADWLFFLKKRFIWKEYWIEINKYKVDNKTGKDVFVDSYLFNGLKYMEKYNIWYDTRDLATLSSDN